MIVQKHQNNHLRLEALRATSSSLDTQIRDTLQNLSSTRKDITTTSITVFQDGNAYPIKYNELLNYARRISKTTLPPAGVTNGVPPEGEAAATPVNGTQSAAPSAAPTPTQTHSQSQPQSQTPEPSSSGAGPNGATAPALASVQPGSDTRTTLPDGLRTILDPHHGTVFVPWPDEFQIRSGALAEIQDLQDKGIDPRGYDPVAVAEEARRKDEDERAAREEAERLKREEDRRRREEWEARTAERQAAAEAARRGSEAASGAAAAGPGAAAETANRNSQFQFASMDMDDDDDDDD